MVFFRHGGLPTIWQQINLLSTFEVYYNFFLVLHIFSCKIAQQVFFNTIFRFISSDSCARKKKLFVAMRNIENASQCTMLKPYERHETLTVRRIDNWDHFHIMLMSKNYYLQPYQKRDFVMNCVAQNYIVVSSNQKLYKMLRSQNSSFETDYMFWNQAMKLYSVTVCFVAFSTLYYSIVLSYLQLMNSWINKLLPFAQCMGNQHCEPDNCYHSSSPWQSVFRITRCA